MVIHYPFFGGPHNQALRLALPLAARGIETTVLLPDEPGNACVRLRSAGVDVVVAPLHRLRARPNPVLQARYVVRFARDVATIRRVIRERGIDVVEVNGLVNAQAAVAARLERVPVVWQVLDTRTPKVLRYALAPFVRMLAGSVMTTGRGVARAHPGLGRLNGRLVPFFPPVDVDAFRPGSTLGEARTLLGLPPGVPVVGTVANITPQKGLEHFVAAAAEIVRAVPDARFVVLGRPMESQPRYHDRIRRAISSHGLDEALTIADPGDDVALYLRALDVFLLTSVRRSEGIPTTVLEAMATGVPVVAARVGAVDEAVEDGRTGLLVPPEQPHELAAATLRLLGDKPLQLALGHRARERARERFCADRCAAVHVQAIAVAQAHQPGAIG